MIFFTHVTGKLSSFFSQLEFSNFYRLVIIITDMFIVLENDKG